MEASTNRVPTIGPVQEKDTNARVNAIKKMPIKPPLSDALSLLLTQDAGSCSSNAPKKDAPKIINKRKIKGIKELHKHLNLSSWTRSPMEEDEIEDEVEEKDSSQKSLDFF